LRVDLSTGDIRVEEHDDSFYRTYIGGRNLIAYYLLKEVPPGTDAFDPQNRFVFATGVLTGTPAGGTGRSAVGAKSPLTGGYGEAEAGGFFGAELKRAGYDAIVIQGSSPRPVYLWLSDKANPEIRPADHLWGLKVADAHARLKEETKENLVRTALIGPAGERLVRFASVMHDISHAAGRTGMGAVMGSKNLKGVAVRGRRNFDLADPDKIKAIGKWLSDNVDTYCGWAHQMGTPGSIVLQDRAGTLPTRNWTQTTFDGAPGISGEKMHDTILVGRGSCWACPVRCKQVVAAKTPYEIDPVYGGPEYETLAAFGSLCGVDDIVAVCKANEICNAYSLDTITTGSMIAMAMETYEKGILTRTDTGGIEAGFGNAEAMVLLTEMIAKREGLGRLLGEGPRRFIAALAEERKGSDKIRELKKMSLEVKGQPLPFHEPRKKHGMALGYAVSPAGADHCVSLFDETYAPEGWGMDEMRCLGILDPVPMQDMGPEKVRMCVYHGYWKSLINSLLVCLFMPYTYNQQAELVSAATGWNSTTFELAKAGERGIVMARLFNHKHGFTSADDDLPERLFDTPVGPRGGPYHTLSRDEFKRALSIYYGMMGWDKETGVPMPEKLVELGIEWAGEGQ
jgi:aldehyde:ferredoxin oxidoreductase